MPLSSQNRRLIRAFTCVLLTFLIGSMFPHKWAEAQEFETEIDPRLYELVETIKRRVHIDAPGERLRGTEIASRDELYLDLISKIETSAYSLVPEQIEDSVKTFTDVYKEDGSVGLDRVASFYLDYAHQLKLGANPDDLQDLAARYSEDGNWFERYTAVMHASFLYSTRLERQAALQKAQTAFALIPENSNENAYIKFAKSRVTLGIAHLHNLQGNSDLALNASLDYLKLAESEFDPRLEIDLINNLIYSYTVGRDHSAQLYLSQALLEIEKSHTSSVAGLSDMRIAGVMNAMGRYEEGLKHAGSALERADNATIIRVSQVAKSVALAGLGQKNKAREIAADVGVNLDRQHMLKTETRQGDLYLAFLLAQSEDAAYATQLFNRQLDVTAQKFLANNSRDTTAMLAELENSRVRQAERVAAAAREAQLQALTIDRQKKLNRVLIALSLLLGCAAISSIIFIRYRGKIVRQLEIKTVEAASAEKLKTEFLGMISHELRTPLNGIIGISDFLANYHEDPDIREKTGIVLRSGNELLAVVESLTDMARLDAGQLELAPHDADLSAALSALPSPWAAKAEEKGVSFTHFIDPSITTHYVDEDRLIQCLNILLENAVRFTQKGRVHLHITAKETGPDGDVSMTAIIADTGQGMSELVQSRLFTPFMQADTSRKRTHMGTGLSLAIAYALAEMMGGQLSVMSREGRGSEFKLEVPLAAMMGVGLSKGEGQEDKGVALEDSATEITPFDLIMSNDAEEPPILGAPVLDGPDAPRREVVDLMQPHSGFPSLHEVEALVMPEPAEGRQRILVVDDVDSNRDILRLILETQGHSCSEAADGFAALAALEKQTFDLIVLDIHMAPMDGVETLHRLRGSGTDYANIAVIALTADNAASTNAACMDAGADLFLTKPVKQDELLRAIGYLNKTDNVRILSG